MRKKNQQSLPENLNKYSYLDSYQPPLIVDPQIQKGELFFSPENRFFPVLGIKKNTNIYQKKLMKKKQGYLKLTQKKELYKSQHFNKNNISDDEMMDNHTKNEKKNVFLIYFLCKIHIFRCSR